MEEQGLSTDNVPQRRCLHQAMKVTLQIFEAAQAAHSR